MVCEHDQLENDHKAWELREKPEGVKSIPCTWVYVQKERPTVKQDEAEKARLCAKGDMPEFGVN